MTPLQIQPVTRLQRVRGALKKTLRDGSFSNCVIPLTKGDARLMLQLIDEALAKTENDQAIAKD